MFYIWCWGSEMLNPPIADGAYKAFVDELERKPEALPTAEQQLDARLEQAAGRSIQEISEFGFRKSTHHPQSAHAPSIPIHVRMLYCAVGQAPAAQNRYGPSAADFWSDLLARKATPAEHTDCSLMGFQVFNTEVGEQAAQPVITPLMQHLQQLKAAAAQKLAAPAAVKGGRKGVTKGRGLASALHSISEGAGNSKEAGTSKASRGSQVSLSSHPTPPLRSEALVDTIF